MTEYERWLKEPLDDQDLTEELHCCQDQPEEINDRFYRDLEFGTGGPSGRDRRGHQPDERLYRA